MNSKMFKTAKEKLYNFLGHSVICKSWKEKNKSLVDAMEMESESFNFYLRINFFSSFFQPFIKLNFIINKEIKRSRDYEGSWC